MATSKPIVRAIVDPSIYERMEQQRRTMRRMSRSHFIEDAILEKVERMEQHSLNHEGPRRDSAA